MIVCIRCSHICIFLFTALLLLHKKGHFDEHAGTAAKSAAEECWENGTSPPSQCKESSASLQAAERGDRQRLWDERTQEHWLVSAF